MQKTFTPTLEQVMKNTEGYLFVLTISLLLAAPIIQAIQTLLAMRARVIYPLLRLEAGQHYSTLITSARSMDAIICPHCDHTIESSQTTFTQPRRVL
jgi:hypothetical protein